jgi:Tol biopolymer transport system component
VAVALRTKGLAHLTVVSADGAERRSLAEGIHVRGTAAWSPDAKWIVTGGRDDAEGPGLFKIPVDGGKPFRLVTGQAFDPVWSPNGDGIVYPVAIAEPRRSWRCTQMETG